MKNIPIETIRYVDKYTYNQMLNERAEQRAIEIVKNRDRKIRKRKAEKRRQLKQILCFKALSLLCLIGGVFVLFVDPAEGSAAVALVGIGLIGLVAPFNTTITW